MVRCLTLILCLGWSLAVAQPNDSGTEFEPPPDDYDWVQLTSGEWLKGEFISLIDDEIEFESDILDTVVLDLDDVRRLRTRRTYGISLQGTDPFTGAVLIEEQRVIILAAGDRREYSRDRLIAITRTADRERERWTGDIGLGINIRRGNADVIEYNMLAGVERRTPRSRTTFDYLGNFNETDGEEIANNHRLNGNIDLFTDSRFFWRPFIGQYYRDKFQNIRHQGTFETGAGYELADTPRTDWEISGGLGLNYVRFDSVEPGEDSTNSSPALSFATDFETEVTAWLDYLLQFHMTFLNKESGTYQHHLLTTLSTDLIGDLDIDISFVWDRTQNPQKRADGTTPEKDDYRFIFGLSYDF
jgi:hypothetical protein